MLLLFCFREASLKTTGGSEIELNKYVGPVSTMVRLLTSKDGDLSSCFDKIDESEGEIDNNSPKHILINNHTVASKQR